MANNRMFLVHRPTGNSVYIGKRMALGWYDVPDDVGDAIKNLFEILDDEENFETQDDFAVGLEDVQRAPLAVDFDMGSAAFRIIKTNAEVVRTLGDLNDGEFYSGYQPMHGKDVEKWLLNRVKAHNSDVILVATRDHFIGTIPYEISPRSFEWKGKSYQREQFSILKDGVLHTAYVVRDVPELPCSPSIPAPFDRWKVGGDKLPLPSMKANISEVGRVECLT